MVSSFKIQEIKNQVDLFSAEDNQSSLIKVPELKDIEAWSEKKSLTYEKEVLGMYVSGHPLLEHADDVEEFTSVDFSDSLTLKKNEVVTVGGMVTKITKNMIDEIVPWHFLKWIVLVGM